MEPEPQRIEVGSELDLHTFRPRDLPDLLPAWFEECRRKGIRQVRVVHGKGSGTLREGVHALLRQLPEVAEFQYPAGAGSGSWGATWVFLRE